MHGRFIYGRFRSFWINGALAYPAILTPHCPRPHVQPQQSPSRRIATYSTEGSTFQLSPVTAKVRCGLDDTQLPRLGLRYLRRIRRSAARSSSASGNRGGQAPRLARERRWHADHLKDTCLPKTDAHRARSACAGSRPQRAGRHLFEQPTPGPESEAARLSTPRKPPSGGAGRLKCTPRDLRQTPARQAARVRQNESEPQPPVPGERNQRRQVQRLLNTSTEKLGSLSRPGDLAGWRRRPPRWRSARSADTLHPMQEVVIARRSLLQPGRYRRQWLAEGRCAGPLEGQKLRPPFDTCSAGSSATAPRTEASTCSRATTLRDTTAAAPATAARHPRTGPAPSQVAVIDAAAGLLPSTHMREPVGPDPRHCSPRFQHRIRLIAIAAWHASRE